MSILLILANRLFSKWRTADSAPVTVRQIRHDDAGALQGFVRALSPASQRMRFHAALNELSETMLEAFTCVDQRRHVAFVLKVTERGTERIDDTRLVCGDEVVLITESGNLPKLAERWGAQPRER